MKIIILVMGLVIGLVLLCGCGSYVKAIKMKEGIDFKSNKPFDASYKDEEVEASASTKGKGLFEGMIQPVGQKIIE